MTTPIALEGRALILLRDLSPSSFANTPVNGLLTVSAGAGGGVTGVGIASIAKSLAGRGIIFLGSCTDEVSAWEGVSTAGVIDWTGILFSGVIGWAEVEDEGIVG